MATYKVDFFNFENGSPDDSIIVKVVPKTDDIMEDAVAQATQIYCQAHGLAEDEMVCDWECEPIIGRR